MQARAARGRHAGPSSESTAPPSTQPRAGPLMERGPVPGKPDTPEKRVCRGDRGWALCGHVPSCERGPGCARGLPFPTLRAAFIWLGAP